MATLLGTISCFCTTTFPIFHFRVIKSGIAVIIALSAGRLLGLPYLLFPAFVAVLGIKQTFFTGLHRAKAELISSAYGAIIALIFYHIIPWPLISISLASMMVITLCLKFKWYESIPISIFTQLFIMTMPGDNIFMTAQVKFLSVITGILSATAVNFLLGRLEYSEIFHKRLACLSKLTEEQFERLLMALKNRDIEYNIEFVANSLEMRTLIRYIHGKLDDLRLEFEFHRNIKTFSPEKADCYEKILDSFKNITRIFQNINVNTQYLIRYFDNVKILDKPVMETILKELTVTNEKIKAEFLEITRAIEHQTPLHNISGPDWELLNTSQLFKLNLADYRERAARVNVLNVISIYHKYFLLKSELQKLPVFINSYLSKNHC